MKKTVTALLLCVISCTTAFCQSADFMLVYNACLKAQSSMSGRNGSKNEIREAKEDLTKASWSTLILQTDEAKNESPVKGHMVFTPAFFAECEKGRTVFKKAEEYAAEETATQRGSEVQLCTKCIKGRSSVTYGYRANRKTLNVAAVAEVNGKINVYVKIKDSKGHTSAPYKVSSNEFKGDSKRLLDTIKLPGGLCEVYITIENKYKKAKSVAIIVE